MSANIHGSARLLCGGRRSAGDDDARRRGVSVQFIDQAGAMGKYGTLVDRSFVGDLADVERRRLDEQNGPADPRRGAAARRRQFGEQGAKRARTRESASTAEAGASGARPGASLRHASMSGKISAATSSRSGAASTASRTNGAHSAINPARNGPTLTQVPVASLKSSASRPSNTRPFAGSSGSSNFSASPIL